MHGDALNWVRTNLSGPDALLPRIRALFGSSRAGVDPQQSPAQIIDTCLQERRQVLTQLKTPWVQWAQELRDICLPGRSQ